MVDFSSALYLGFEHGSGSLPGWRQLTLGKPAALEEVPQTERVQRALAELTGCGRVVLGASTLHLFSDLFGMLAGSGDLAIWMDEAAYPIARWGTDRAAVRGVPVRTFAGHDAVALRNAVNASRRARPVIVTDGFCPIRGEPAPLAEYAQVAAASGGLLVVDDTQALGLFGRAGGGSLRHFGLDDGAAPVVVVSSLAKAFGAPVAMLGGSRDFVDEFHAKSTTVVHCSPPSAVAVLAAWQALELNRQWGDVLRRRLAERVARFRRGLPEWCATRTCFPVQLLRTAGRVDARIFYQELLGQAVRPVLHRDAGGGARISFLLSARHEWKDVDAAVTSVAAVIRRLRVGPMSAPRAVWTKI